MGTINQGNGHKTTYAHIIANEIGIHSDCGAGEEGARVYRRLMAWALRITLDAVAVRRDRDAACKISCGRREMRGICGRSATATSNGRYDVPGQGRWVGGPFSRP